MKVLKKLLPYVKPHKGRLCLAFLAMAVMAACQTLAMYLLKPLIDEIFITKNEYMLWIVIYLIPLVFLVRAIAMYATNYFTGYISHRMAQKLREDLFGHLNSLSLEFFWARKTGEILSRVTNDLTNVQDMVQYVPLFFIRDLLTAVGLTGILFYLSWKFAFVSLLLFPFIGLVIARLAKKMRQAASASQSHIAGLYHQFAEALQGIVAIKAFRYEIKASQKFGEENSRYFDQIMRYVRATSVVAPIMEFVGSLGVVLLLYFGARAVLAKTMSAGDFFTFLGAFFAVYMPVKNLANANTKLQVGIVSLERLFHILDEKPTVLEPLHPKSFKGLAKAIEFDQVSYRYPSRERWALKGVTINIRHGETVALVGPSGSGKSTAAHLVLRLFDPTEGRVLVDGVDLREISISSLREQMGLVTQDTILFNDTVAENVALGRSAAISQIEATCRSASADDFIRELPQGYNTSLGDKGVRLSGGQRQRLAIARAIMTNPSILILDEATSNLDSNSERAIQQAILNLKRERTVLVITHRLSMMQEMDRIIVLRDGCVVEEGNHQSLLAARGVYRNLHELQSVADIPLET